ncbi:17149_t:CDS:1, partial [Gigaspora rosea]
TRKKRANCVNAHNNENEIGLHMIGNWILDIASSADENLNQNLLSKLLHSLTVYWRNDRLNNLNQLYTKDSSSEFIPITTNSSSIFIKNTCLKLGKADKLIQQKYEKILPDDSLKFGQKLVQLLLSNNKNN